MSSRPQSLLLVALLTACGSSSSDDAPPIRLDAGDLGGDASSASDAGAEGRGPAAGELGGTCDSDEACGTGECYRNSTEPGGACSAVCGVGMDCPDGSLCYSEFGEPQLETCRAECETSADCRPGQFCDRAGLCLAGCGPDAPCPDGQRCVERYEGDVSPQCRSEDASVGDACRYDSECPEGARCASELVYGEPGGTCMPERPCPEGWVQDRIVLCRRACTPDEDSCPETHRCAEVEGGKYGCVPDCSSDDDCLEEGHVCDGGTGLCIVEPEYDQLGQPCSGHILADDCTGFCVDGWPEGLCAFPCAEGNASGRACPSGSSCVDRVLDVAPDATFCLPTCEAPSDCREGYTCTERPEGRVCTPSA